MSENVGRRHPNNVHTEWTVTGRNVTGQQQRCSNSFKTKNALIINFSLRTDKSSVTKFVLDERFSSESCETLYHEAVYFSQYRDFDPRDIEHLFFS